MLVEDDARSHGAVRLGVEGLRDDRLALRLDARAQGSRRRLQRAAEPLDVERLLDHAEGGRRRADRTAGLRHRDARPSTACAGISSCEWLAVGAAHPLVKPAGAFYLFPDVSEFLSPDGVRTSAELAQSLLDDPRVAVTPGEAFDAPGFLRISYAASMEDLERGTRKIIEHLRSIESRTTARLGVRALRLKGPGGLEARLGCSIVARANSLSQAVRGLESCSHALRIPSPEPRAPSPAWSHRRPRAVVGSEHIRIDDDARITYGTDALKRGHPADVVVLPGSTG